VVSVAIVEGYGKTLSVYRGNLVVVYRDNGKKVRKVVNLAEVDRVIITTSGIALTSRALRLLARYGIDLVVLDPRGIPITTLTPPWITATVDSRRGQYIAYTNESLALEIAKSIACAKILNQAGYVKYLAKVLGDSGLAEESEKIFEICTYIRRVSGSLDSARKSLMAYEGTAARIYWGSIATVLPCDLGFDDRDQDGLDPVNRSLNYLYGVLYAESFKTLVRVGLDPYAGFLHADRSGNPVLVFDYVEMFRVSAVDSLLVGLFRRGFRISTDDRGYIARESRAKLIQEFYNWFSRKARDSRGEVRKLEEHVKSYAIKFAKFFRVREGDVPVFVEVWWI
jgi:CRISPR-associated protein Cas1